MDQIKEINNNEVERLKSFESESDAVLKPSSTLTSPSPSEDFPGKLKLVTSKPDSIPKTSVKPKGSALENALLEIVVISFTWFFPYFPLLLIYVSEMILLLVRSFHSIEMAIRWVAELWTSYMSLFHQQKIVGLENIPSDGPGLIVWYHGPLPVDYIGLVATVCKQKKRKMYTVVDRCLSMMPGLDMFRRYLRVGAFSKVKIAGLLEEGELVGVAPGGARECLFDHDVSVLWNERVGFAKVGGLTQVPIIPVYTENIRLAYKTMRTGTSIFRPLFEMTKLPLIPLYGGFPVQLTTHVGDPLFVMEGETALEFQKRIRLHMQSLIKTHQRDIDVVTALEERFKDSNLMLPTFKNLKL